MDGTSQTWASGFGTIKLPLVNARKYDYSFTYYTAGGAVASSQPVMFANTGVCVCVCVCVCTQDLSTLTINLCHPSDEPTQVHLALTASPSEMRVMWTTLDNTTTPMVRWGRAPSALNSSAAASTITYTVHDMCAGVANERYG